MELGGTTSTKRSQNGPMEPPDHDGPLPLGPPVPTDIDQKVNQLLQHGPLPMIDKACTAEYKFHINVSLDPKVFGKSKI